MTTHPSILAFEIPWTEEPSGLQSMAMQRVGHNLMATHACTLKPSYILESPGKTGNLPMPRSNQNTIKSELTSDEEVSVVIKSPQMIQLCI